MLPFRSGSVITAKISDTRPKIVRQKLNVSSVEKVAHTKDAQTEKKQPKCANCNGPHVPNYKLCPAYKNRCSINMWWTTKKGYASILKQNSAPPPQPKGDTFSFTADQLIKFVATVAIQIAQPQVCYSNAPKDAVDKTSSLCQRVSKAAQNQLGISISGSTLFGAICSVRSPVFSASKIPFVIPEPFRFSASTNPIGYKFNQTDREVFELTLEAALSSGDVPELKSTQHISMLTLSLLLSALQ